MHFADNFNNFPVQGEMNEWTPYNAELQMQSIKVLVKDPVPSKVTGGSFEDTMLLLEMVKEKQQKENKELKVGQNNRQCVVMSRCLFQIFFINNEYLPSPWNHLTCSSDSSCHNSSSASF